LVPQNLEFALDQEAGQERALTKPPAPSTATSGDTTTGDKPIGARDQHGRHKKYDDVHMIAQVGPSGEPLLPIEVLGKFSNQCSVIVRRLRSRIRIERKFQKDSSNTCGRRC
jgi:hypothetical protein